MGNNGFHYYPLLTSPTCRCTSSTDLNRIETDMQWSLPDKAETISSRGRMIPADYHKHKQFQHTRSLLHKQTLIEEESRAISRPNKAIVNSPLQHPDAETN